MRIGDYTKTMEMAFRLKKQILVVGEPGVGKTFGKMQAAIAAGFKYIGLCAPLEDPSTVRGYPFKGENGRAAHLLFDAIAAAMDATEPTVMDWDDLGMASESTMRSIIRFFQFREIDGRKLPDHVVLSASTNDIGHSAGVYGMIEPLKSRFHSIINVETHIDDVVVYALANNWPTDLIAYLRNSPDALHDWKPEKSMKPGGACPRSWEFVAEWINGGVDDPEIIAGAVGQGRGASYLAFRRLMNDLPDIDQVLLDPESAPIPEDPSARWLISTAIAGKMNAGNFGQCAKYLGRFQEGMFRAYSIRDAFKAEAAKREQKKLPKDYKPLASSRDFVAWSSSPDGKNVMSAISM